MRTIIVKQRIEAQNSKVWSVLADFPNIADWNTGLKKSYATSDATQEVGAKRHCDLVPFGALEETVDRWDEGKTLVIRIDSAQKLPIANGLATFTPNSAADTTEVAVQYDYQPKFGPFGQLLGILMLDRQLTKGFKGFLTDLSTAAVERD